MVPSIPRPSISIWRYFSHLVLKAILCGSFYRPTQNRTISLHFLVKHIVSWWYYHLLNLFNCILRGFNRCINLYHRHRLFSFDWVTTGILSKIGLLLIGKWVHQFRVQINLLRWLNITLSPKLSSFYGAIITLMSWCLLCEKSIICRAWALRDYLTTSSHYWRWLLAQNGHKLFYLRGLSLQVNEDLGFRCLLKCVTVYVKVYEAGIYIWTW